MSEQLPLPGVSPADEQATPEETAKTVLIFDSDDAIERRIFEAVRTLFFAPPSATGRVPMADANCRALFERLVNAHTNTAAFPGLLETTVRTWVAQEVAKQLDVLRAETKKQHAHKRPNRR